MPTRINTGYIISQLEKYAAEGDHPIVGDSLTPVWLLEAAAYRLQELTGQIPTTERVSSGWQELQKVWGCVHLSGCTWCEWCHFGVNPGKEMLGYRPNSTAEDCRKNLAYWEDKELAGGNTD